MPLEQHLIESYLEMLVVSRNLSSHTIAAYRRDLEAFASFTKAALKTTDDEVNKYLEQQEYMGLSARTQARRLSGLRGFYKYLLERGDIKKDPTARQEAPKLPKTLPKALTSKQAKSLLETCKGSKPKDLRLRVIIHMLYGCGLRVSELTQLKLGDIAAGEGIVLRVRGKGGKVRLVPLGVTVSATLEAYIALTRIHFDKINFFILSFCC